MSVAVENLPSTMDTEDSLNHANNAITTTIPTDNNNSANMSLNSNNNISQNNNNSSSSASLGYVKLLGKGWEALINTTNFVLGRRMENSPTVNTSNSETVVGVSSNKNISRRHARIYFDSNAGHWLIECLGKNGITVNEEFLLLNQKTALSSDNNQFMQQSPPRILIGEEVFFFLLPIAQANN
jgi:hypothetical protein